MSRRRDGPGRERRGLGRTVREENDEKGDTGM
jgi:hypothetical protein